MNFWTYLDRNGMGLGLFFLCLAGILFGDCCGHDPHQPGCAVNIDTSVKSSPADGGAP